MKKAKSSSNRTSSLEVTFVYVSSLDLFSGLCKAWHRGIDIEENVGASSSVQSHELVEPINEENDFIAFEHPQETVYSEEDSGPSESFSFTVENSDRLTQTVEGDFVLFPSKETDGSTKLSMKEAKSSSNRTSSSEVTFVYVSSLDLFSGLGKACHRGIDMEENVGASSSIQSHELVEPIIEENDFIDFEHPQETVYSEEDNGPSESFSSASENSDRLTQTVERDFVLFPSKETDRSTELSMKEAKSSSNRTSSLEVPFFYVPLDLFSGLRKSWHRGIDMEENVGASSSVQYHELVEPISEENFPSKETDRSTKLSMKEAKSSSNRTSSLEVPFVYPSLDVFIDFFSGLGTAWPRGIDMEENVDASSSVQSHELVEPISEEIDFIAFEHPQETVDSEEDSGPSESFSSASENRDRLTQTVERDLFLDFIASEHPQETVDSEEDSGPSESYSFASENSDLLTETVERDFVLAQILRLTCTSKPQLANALPEIASELYRIGIISKEVRDLATNPSSLNDQNIQHILRKRMDSSKVPQFWKALSENGVESASTSQSSR